LKLKCCNVKIENYDFRCPNPNFLYTNNGWYTPNGTRKCREKKYTGFFGVFGSVLCAKFSFFSLLMVDRSKPGLDCVVVLGIGEAAYKGLLLSVVDRSGSPKLVFFTCPNIQHVPIIFLLPSFLHHLPFPRVAVACYGTQNTEASDTFFFFLTVQKKKSPRNVQLRENAGKEGPKRKQRWIRLFWM